MKVFLKYLAFFIVYSTQAVAQDQMQQNCAKQIFQTIQEEHFEKFKGNIVRDGQTIKYDDVSIRLENGDSSIMLLFESGILYPKLFDGISISNIEEINFADKSFKTKRFKLLIWAKNKANPSLYFFELINENANKELDLRSFIIGSKLNIFKFCSILI